MARSWAGHWAGQLISPDPVDAYFPHIWGKGCGQDISPTGIALWVTSETTINLQVTKYSLQADNFLWKIPLPSSLHQIIALPTQTMVG